jgi:hypothetical protein
MLKKTTTAATEDIQVSRLEWRLRHTGEKASTVVTVQPILRNYIEQRRLFS